MKLPDYFARVLWSYDLSDLDSERDKAVIITNTINYGDLRHWKWIKNCYGKEEIRRILSKIPASQIRERVKPLVSIMFEVKQFNHAPRSPN